MNKSAFKLLEEVEATKRNLIAIDMMKDAIGLGEYDEKTVGGVLYSLLSPVLVTYAHIEEYLSAQKGGAI